MRNGLIRRYNITPEDYHMIEIVIIENKPHKAGPQWKFAGAFYFATVVLAMIGYGHSTPVTYGGKAFCMAYAMVNLFLFNFFGRYENIIMKDCEGKIVKKHPWLFRSFRP